MPLFLRFNAILASEFVYVNCIILYVAHYCQYIIIAKSDIFFLALLKAVFVQLSQKGFLVILPIEFVIEDGV